MKHFLTEAFNFTATSIENIQEVFHRVGLFACRLVADEGMFKINPEFIKSPRLRDMIELYERQRPIVWEKAHEFARLKSASADFNPRPSVKPALKMIEVLINHLTKLPASGFNMVAMASLAVVAGTTIAILNGHHTHMGPPGPT